MGLFKKKNKTVDGGTAKVLQKERLVSGTKMNERDINEIVKTTDSMKMIAETQGPGNMEDAAKAINSTFSMASKKIISVYEDLIETKKIIDNEFLTVQLLIGQYEKNSDLESILRVVSYFTEEFEAQVAYGRSVKVSNRILVEPHDYAGKIIPVARIVEPGYVGLNTVTWKDLSEILKKGNLINTVEQESIEYLAEAIEANILNGYYLKLGNLVVAKINVEEDNLMVLFSKETIGRLNSSYTHERIEKRKTKIDKTNYIQEYKDSVDTHAEEEAELKEKLKIVEDKMDQIKKEKTAVILKKEQEFAEGMKKVEEIQRAKDKKIKQSKLLDEDMDVEDVILSDEFANPSMNIQDQVDTSEIERKELLDRIIASGKAAEEEEITEEAAPKKIEKKKVAKKATTKKATTKKAPSTKTAKKPAAKKAETKKPAAKKPAAKKATKKK